MGFGEIVELFFGNFVEIELELMRLEGWLGGGWGVLDSCLEEELDLFVWFVFGLIDI